MPKKNRKTRKSTNSTALDNVSRTPEATRSKADPEVSNASWYRQLIAFGKVAPDFFGGFLQF